MTRTTVISVRGQDRAALLADPNFCYIGRQCAGWPASPFANPFRLKEYPVTALMQFESCLKVAMMEAKAGYPPVDERDRNMSLRFLFRWMVENLGTIRGKRLGCWCCNWDGISEPAPLCHGVVLAKLCDEGVT